MTSSDAEKKAALAERKRKRLEAWRRRQQEQQEKQGALEENGNIAQQSTSSSSGENLSSSSIQAKSSIAPKVSMTMKLGGSGVIGISMNKKKKKQKKKKSTSAFLTDFDTEGEKKNIRDESNKEKLLLLEDLQTSDDKKKRNQNNDSSGSKKKKRKWDDEGKNKMSTNHVSQNNDAVEDDLDKFMNQLNKGAMGTVAVQNSAFEVVSKGAHLDGNGKSTHSQFQVGSGGVMTAEMLTQLNKETTNDEKKDLGVSDTISVFYALFRLR